MSTPTRRPLLSAATVIGIGMGGFVDGILFHQLLQVHNMLSARVPPRESIPNMEVNMFWDGLFHTFTWAATAIGIWLLFRAARRPDVLWDGRVMIGGVLLGAGLFNLVEGLLNHHVLQIHHVVETHGLSLWDWGFLLSGVVLIVVGVLLARSPQAAVSH